MFKINTKEIKKFERDLKGFAHKAYPFATKNTVNTAAFRAQKLAKRDIEIKMVLRNSHARQSIQVEQSTTLKVSRQAAVIGSTADYMEDQEFGTTIVSKGKKGVSIPTGYSAGQEGQSPRTRLPRKPNKLVNIRLKHSRRKLKTRRARNAARLREAASSGHKYIYLDLGKSEGIFKVIGGKRNPRIKMIHDMSRKSVVIPRNPWLKPVVDTVQVLIPKIYRDALVFQLKRQGLFRG